MSLNVYFTAAFKLLNVERTKNCTFIWVGGFGEWNISLWVAFRSVCFYHQLPFCHLVHFRRDLCFLLMDCTMVAMRFMIISFNTRALQKSRLISTWPQTQRQKLKAFFVCLIRDSGRLQVNATTKLSFQFKSLCFFISTQKKKLFILCPCHSNKFSEWTSEWVNEKDKTE